MASLGLNPGLYGLAIPINWGRLYFDSKRLITLKLFFVVLLKSFFKAIFNDGNLFHTILRNQVFSYRWFFFIKFVEYFGDDIFGLVQFILHLF